MKRLTKRPKCSVIEPLEGRLMLAVAPVTTKILFLDGFDGIIRANPKNWEIPTWRFDGDGTWVGRTQFRCSQNADLPSVSGSAVHIPIDTNNPTGYSLYGTDLLTNQSFSVNDGIVLIARVKMNPMPNGIIGAAFFYNDPDENGEHDEIDTEILSNQLNSTNKAHTNFYASQQLGAGSPLFVTLPKGTLADYHEYRMEIWPTGVTRWYVDGALKRTETITVPTRPMQVHLNMWATDNSWPAAYSPDIQPTDANANKTYTMDVDYVLVSQVIKPAPVLPGIVITKVSPYGQSGTVSGYVTGVKPSDYELAVFIKVDGKWWTKPSFASPATVIQPDGSWSANITTGGRDIFATSVNTFLVPKGTKVPACAGTIFLPVMLTPFPHMGCTR